MKVKFNYFLFLGTLLAIIFFILNTIYIGFDEYVGQTETLKIDLNTEQDVYVEAIHVKAGQRVKQGDLLMTLKNVSVDNQNTEIEIGLKNIDKIENLEASEINANIVKIKSERNQKISQLQSELKKAQEEADFQEKIFQVANKKIDNQSSNVLITSLKDQIKTTEKEYNELIRANIKILNLPKKSSIDEALNQQRKLNNLNSLDRLKIVAPFDGIINTIHVSSGQFVVSHGALINFSELVPSKTTAFVYERKTLSIKEGDSVKITSRYNTQKSMKGKVSAIGNKFVLMPQKISEFPGLELFGRELYITNTQENSFLDNESVLIHKIINP